MIRISAAAIFIFAVLAVTFGQNTKGSDYEIAARFAPVLYQALGDDPRADLITNFNFDGDWRGDNNWEHTADKRFSLKTYIYYSVSQTQTHYFVHYAVFHPRDYKGGQQTGRMLSEILRKGADALGTNDPTGLLSKATVAHENDMEGCLVVVPKGDTADRTVYLETVAHNFFPKFSTAEERPRGVDVLRLDGERPRLYIEPKGHGISAYEGNEEVSRSRFVVYRYEGKADDPEKTTEIDVGYDLLAIKDTLWSKAVGVSAKKGPTYGDTIDYAPVSIALDVAGKLTTRKVDPGALGSAFLGKEGGVNMARPPWGWFDLDHRSDPPGIWFFDPATVMKRDFGLGKEFSTAYTALPFWAVGPATKKPRP